MIPTRVTQLLGIRYPVLQGGMAWVSSAELVAAVSEAGGLGVLGSGPMTPDILRSELQKIRALTTKPFGVNIMLMMPAAPELIAVCCAERVPVITTGAGNPAPHMKVFKDAGCKVIPVVSAVALARRLERAGADAVIAEGTESGGHIGEITTMALLPQVVDAVRVPVIAAGGIADGRGILAAMALGAEGVQMGTRFILARECHVHANYKQVVIKSGDRDTCVTGAMHGHSVRVIKNKLAKQYLELERGGASLEQLDAFAKGSLQKAVREGNVDDGSVMAGQIAGLLNEELSCAEIFAELQRGFRETFARLGGNMTPAGRPIPTNGAQEASA